MPNVDKAGAMSLNLVVPQVINLKIEWFHIINSHKSSGSIEPLSKIKWFHGTTGTTNNAGPEIYRISFFQMKSGHHECSKLHLL